jgi:hypothetical protein
MFLFVITVAFYAWLTGMNIKTLEIGTEINLGLVCLLSFAALFYVCNYAHNFANIVRYQTILYEHIYGVLLLYCCLEVKSRSFEKIMPPFTTNECPVQPDGHSPITLRTVTKFSWAWAGYSSTSYSRTFQSTQNITIINFMFNTDLFSSNS